MDARARSAPSQNPSSEKFYAVSENKRRRRLASGFNGLLTLCNI
jgi:hypothetical protein